MQERAWTGNGPRHLTVEGAPGDAFSAEQRRVLESIAMGAPLPEILERITRITERDAPDLLASILLVEDGRLLHGAAPSLPKAYSDAIHGLGIGVGVGSCGTAAATGERMVVEDVQTHPYWEPFRPLAAEHGLRACWSTPILGRDQRVLGTFAIYHRSPRGPRPAEEHLIAEATHLASVAIQHDRLLKAEVARRAEAAQWARLRELLTGSPVPVAVVKGPELRFEYVNPAYERMVGRSAVEGRLVVDVFPEVEDQGVLELLRGIYEGGSRFRAPEFRLSMDRGKGPEEVYFNVQAEPYRDAAGRVEGVFVVAMEVTDHVRSRVEIDSLRSNLAQSEKLSALGQLVSGVAHEIRTPLTYLATNLNLVQLRLERLVKRLPPSEAEAARMIAEQYVPSALEGVDRINRLVEDLRAFTQTPTRVREARDLSKVVAQGIDLFQATHRGRITIRYEPETSATAVIDPVQIQQAIINLLQNALEAEPRDLSVRVQVGRDEDGSAWVLVSDSGGGIPDEARARVFDPFFTTRQGGTGLGLSIVKRVMDEHGGRVSFETGSAGTTFRLALPATPPPR